MHVHETQFITWWTVNRSVHFAFCAGNYIHGVPGAVLLWIKNFLSNRTQQTRITLLLRAYMTYVRPIVEHDSVVWSPYTVKDTDAVESVQRHFTKRLPGYTFLAYSERLKRANLLSLELRRLHFDLIWCYKILFWHVDMKSENFFWVGPTLEY